MTANEELLKDYRSFPGGQWEAVPQRVLKYLLILGLERHHTLLDVGCGPLRVGKHLITFLDRGKYTGIEPEDSMLDMGLDFELCPMLRIYQSPNFYREPIGRREFTADWAVGWDVFNHLSPAMLRLALTKIHAKWIMNLHLGEQHFTAPADGEGWSYRYADTKVCVYTGPQIKSLIAECGYVEKVIDVFPSGWEGYPFSVFYLQPCSTLTGSCSSTSPVPEERG